MSKKSIFIILLFALQLMVVAQNKVVNIYGIEGLKINYNSIAKDSIAANKVVSKVLLQLHKLAFLAATVDSANADRNTINYYISKGKKYKWVKLSTHQIDEELINQIDINGKLFTERPFNKEQLQKLYKKSVTYLENNGYPFAEIKLDSVSINGRNEIAALLVLNKNKYYTVDSIIINGNSTIGRNYLLKYLNLKQNEAYNQRTINNISTRILEIPFISENKPKEVQFFEKGVKIVLDLKKKKASRFDGILGLLTNENSGKIELTGDVDLNLINSFNKGEIIDLNWRKLKGNSQDLVMGFEYPYLFKSQFGIDYDFKLFKRDTTFLDLTNRFGVNYILSQGESVTLFLENKSSSLLSKNAIIQNNTNTAPSLGDVSINSFGVSYSTNKTDYKFNPTKGLRFFASFSAGRKKLTKIAALEEENPNIYEGVDLSTNQFNGAVNVAYFLPIKTRNTIKFGNQSAAINSENIYQNELLRIGGLKVLRGFDEESINASAYSVFTLEYRYLLDKNSYFSLFSDAAYYENKSVNNSSVSDTPIGFGAGISFETKAGIFTFNYAVGKQFDNPVQFRAAKIHFGFVNFF